MTPDDQRPRRPTVDELYARSPDFRRAYHRALGIANYGTHPVTEPVALNSAQRDDTTGEPFPTDATVIYAMRKAGKYHPVDCGTWRGGWCDCGGFLTDADEWAWCEREALRTAT
jgi:hypothetical protein